jgi:5-formyltetrahydrofolate cyclo-ligase
MNNKSKNVFRKYCINKQKNIKEIFKLKINKKIEKYIENIIIKNKYKNILLYLPLKQEVDLKHLINKLRKNNINVFVPYMISKNEFKIVPYRLPLKKKKYNIYEPYYSNFVFKIKLDLAIIPIIGYDNTFRRVGFGVGFYDRYFSSLNYTPKIIFTQLHDCKCENIITNDYDVKANIIINKKGIKWKI